MAEILGITAGAIGILRTGTSASVRLRDVFKAWKNAPAELLALHNEVEDLRVVVSEISNAVTTVEGASREDGAFANALSDEIDKARQHLKSLDTIIHELSTIKKYKKKYKWVRKSGRVDALKGQLRGVRERMQSLMVAHNVTKSTRIELELLSVRTAGTWERENIARGLEQATTTSTDTHGEISAIRNELQTLTSSMAEIDGRTQQLPTTMAHLETRVTNAHDGVARMAQNIGQITAQMDSKIERLIAWSTEGGQRGHHVPFSGSQVRSNQTIRFFTARRNFCPLYCVCRCHPKHPSYNEWRLPRQLAPLLGLLFIRYTGCPNGGASCDLLECRQRRVIRIELTYTFPAWFLWYTVYMLYETTHGRKPELLLRTSNIVTLESSPLFHACIRGDTQHVIHICRTTPWRVRDKRDREGITPLTYAIQLGFPEIVKILLDTGADPDDVDDDSGQSDRTFAAILALDGRLALDSEICHLLNINQLIADMDIPQLTREVMRLPHSMPIEDYISFHPSKSLAEVNSQDELGRTALHWACQRGDSNTVSALLRLGADPNQESSRISFMMTPLHLAAKAINGASCVSMLCEAGASFKGDIYGRTALHLACRTVETMKILVRHGCPVESIDRAGSSPLYWAAEGNSLPALEYLLQLGANPELKDADGDTAISCAVIYNAHNCIDRLLSLPCNHLCVNKSGFSILHSAANFSDTRTMQILARHGLSGLDSFSKDKDGLTAQDAFNKRDAKSEALVESWNELLRSILWTNGTLAMSDEKDGEGVEVFHDAQEEIET